MTPLPSIVVTLLWWVSFVLGWTYMLIWSFSFYLQPYLNWKRKSVVGFSFDYLLMNFIGFSAYSAYTVAFFFSSTLRNDFQEAIGDPPVVDVADMGFAVHSLVLTVFQMGQCVVYDRGNQRITYPFRILTALISIYIVLALALVVLCETRIIEFVNFNWAIFLFALGGVKILVTMVKYIPQALMNFKRLSTVGWSFPNVLCDFSGGIFSFLQLVVDSIRLWNLTPFENLVKLGLSVLALFFDVIFILQHVVFTWILRIGEGYENAPKDIKRGSFAGEIIYWRNRIFFISD